MARALRTMTARRSFACMVVSGVLCGAWLLSGVADAQERPSEDEMFGGQAAAPPTPPGEGASSPAGQAAAATSSDAESRAADQAEPAASTGQAGVPTSDAERDRALLGAQASAPTFSSESPEDPLKIGGRIYLRMQSAALEGQNVGSYALSAPALVDAYFDARPNDRVRAFVLGRMTYDPTLPPSGGTSTLASSVSGSTMGSQSLASVMGGATRGPRVVLDQLWLRFDVEHRVFVTAGKQHVRWGTARFFSPTDYLHLRRRNPLDVLDARAGTTMVKLHLPIESKSWNFYAYGLSEGPSSTPALKEIAGAARAEFVLGTSELGLGAFVHRGDKAKFAADLSSAIGDVDVYGELAVLDSRSIDRVHYDPDAVLPPRADPPSWQNPIDAARQRSGEVIDTLYPVTQRKGYHAQAVVGASYTGKYHDNDTYSIGAEYFYNPLGYSSPTAYPGLLLPHQNDLRNAATFFYLGKHYAALYVSFPAPFSLDLHTFTLSTISNLSDLSFISRLDYALVLLTHLRFEAFVSARYGEAHGEFRLGVKELDLDGYKFSRPPAFLDFGVGLRLDI